jgi:hypothetical protein
VRGAAASATATLLAAVSHTIGGGQPPSALLMLSTTVLLAPLAAFLVGRTTRMVSVAGAVTVTQAVFHLLFAFVGQLPVAGILPGSHVHGALTLADPARASAPPMHASHSAAVMLLAHICAAVVTTALLWRGELMLRAIRRWVHAVLRRPEQLLRESTPFRPRQADPLLTTPLSRILLCDVCRRGPPSLSCG